MFEYFLHFSNAYTVKVGNGASFAKYRLTGINDVESLLIQLSE